MTDLGTFLNLLEENKGVRSDQEITFSNKLTFKEDVTLEKAITGITPTADANLATKKYVDDHAGGGVTSVAGLTGALTVGSAGKTIKITAAGNDINLETASSGSNHSMLSSTHTDTSAGTIARGDILTGQGETPLLTRLAKGNQYEVLKMGANEPEWGKIDVTRSITGSVPVANGGTGLTSAGTDGQILTSLSSMTVWSNNPANVFYYLPACDKANITAVTAMTSNTCHLYYAGVCPKATTKITVIAKVTTGVATITWAEVAVYTGAPTINGNASSLSRAGYTDVSATFNSTGTKKTDVTVSIAAGTHFWIALGSQATTPFQVRGALADEVQTGMCQTFTGRPSTVLSPTCTIFSTAGVPGYVAIYIN